MILFAFTLDRPRDLFVVARSLPHALRLIREAGLGRAAWTGEATKD